MDAWFAPQSAVWFSLLAMLSLLACLQSVAQRGRFQSLVIGAYGAAVALGVVFLVLACAALLLEQPRYVIGSLTLSGTLVTVLLTVALRGIRQVYRDVERRQIIAKDM